ncbi:hypothetical protein [Novosphingobium sp.]|uniref:polysaccharide deacetylase family protein n=1 Tax=Novosphingobium sp. TaxID=1874826 RepID=UPI0025CCC43E|nr:hypothetical protein [Novosphingobium sp.]
MTRLYITVDTEYSCGLALRDGAGNRTGNFARSIACDTAIGPLGIGYQMDRLDQYGLKAVFFVDPMPALVWGTAAIADVVGPIVSRGHDVQLHLHSEWLALAGSNNPVGPRTGRNIADFSLDDQCVLIDRARDLLVAAGAPRPVAFRAGNYGANDDTLRALAHLGIAYDTSHCPAIPGADCAISLGPDDRAVLAHCGVIEVPIGAIGAANGALRHFQLTALTISEIAAALRHAAARQVPSMTLVSHSFELLSRDRMRANQVVKRRFDTLCAVLGSLKDVRTATYASDPPEPAPGLQAVLPHRWPRTLRRMAEQAVGNALYGSS